MSTTPTTKKLLIAIIIVGVALRLGAAFYLGNTLEGEQQTRIYDQRSYHALALSILAGKGYSFEIDWYPFTTANTPTAHWSFLYPLYLAALYFLAGPNPLAARLVQVIISGIGAPLLIFLIGKQIFNTRIGLLAAGLSTVYAYFVFHDAALMTEAYFTLAALGLLYLGLRLAEAERPSWKLWLLFGLIAGVAAVLRQTILLWLPFQFLWMLWRLRKDQTRQAILGMALSAAVMAACILPWTVRNYLVYDSFLPLNSNAGYALYSSNHPDHGDDWMPAYVAPLPEDLSAMALNEAEWNSQLTARALQWIAAEPLRYLALTWDRFLVHFQFGFSAQSSLSANLMRVLSFGLYLPFFISGLALSWSARRQSEVCWRRQASLLYWFGIIFNALHLLTWGSPRYRLPVDAALMPFAALAAWTLLTRLQSILPRRRA